MAIAKLASTAQQGTATVRHCTSCLAVFRTDFERCPQDGGELVVALTDPLINATIADTYVVEALIGEGAMGRVYRARHRTLENQRYAVKVLIGDLAASSTMRLRFAREAQNASRLDHPNVVNVNDYGKTERGLHYLVMDLVEGCSLAELVRSGPMPAERVIRIAHQLCEGLAHAHERGVIHRDFKSDNILVVREPGREVARIADFGLAMSTAHDVRLTTTGVACTPAYAAPEQLRGAEIDHRVDLYGLGVTLFEMLSGGYLPFEGDLDATIAQKLRCEAPSIVTRAPRVPPGLVALVSRLLAHDPDHRPRSARAVIRALETSMTQPRPELRTLDMRPIAKRRTARRARWVAIKGALLATAIAIMTSWQLASDERPIVVTGSRVAEAAPELPKPVVAAASGEPVSEPVTVPEPEPASAVPLALASEPAPADMPIENKRRRGRRAVQAEPVDGPSALDVATRYSDIGRALAELDDDESTAELRRRYRRIRIDDAMSSQRARNAVAAGLDRIERDLDER